MISIEQYRAAIGLFHVLKHRLCRVSHTGISSYFYIYMYLVTCTLFLLLRCGDIESNPGSRHSKTTLSLLSVNINSITVSGKLEELFDCAQQHKAQIIGITESWLGQGINTTLLLLEGYQSPERRDRNKPWFTREVRFCVRQKIRLFHKYRKNPTDHNWQLYKRARNHSVAVNRKAKKDYEADLHTKLLNPSLSPKKYWSLAKSIYGEKRIMSIPSIITNGVPVSDNLRKAELFNQYFVSHSRLSPYVPKLPPFSYKTDARIGTLDVTEAILYNILKSLDTSTATGPDGLGNRVLKETASTLALPLCSLFQYCFKKCYFPSIWKVANVSPIYKKGSRTQCDNYRPISLLCNISKVMERVVHMHLYKYLFTNNLIYGRQSAYPPGDSTAYQLVSLVRFINEFFDNGQEIRTFFLDISKAFDKTCMKACFSNFDNLALMDHFLNG